jgi:hypothetical protein
MSWGKLSLLTTGIKCSPLTFTLKAPKGQRASQMPQYVHFSSFSATIGVLASSPSLFGVFVASMASRGQISTQIPQPVHFFLFKVREYRLACKTISITTSFSSSLLSSFTGVFYHTQTVSLIIILVVFPFGSE